MAGEFPPFLRSAAVRCASPMSGEARITSRPEGGGIGLVPRNRDLTHSERLGKSGGRRGRAGLRAGVCGRIGDRPESTAVVPGLVPGAWFRGVRFVVRARRRAAAFPLGATASGAVRRYRAARLGTAGSTQPARRRGVFASGDSQTGVDGLAAGGGGDLDREAETLDERPSVPARQEPVGRPLAVRCLDGAVGDADP